MKCDETWPICLKCDRLKLNCPGPPALRANARSRPRRPGYWNTEFTQAGILRRRVVQSCKGCRAAKTKCSGQAICARCSEKEIDCVFPITSRQIVDEQSKLSQQPAVQSESEDVDQSRRLQMPNPGSSLSAPAVDSTPNSLAWYAIRCLDFEPLAKLTVEGYTLRSSQMARGSGFWLKSILLISIH